MRKMVSCVGLIVSMGLLAGCDWGSSGSDSSWDDSYSWANFSGVYRPMANKTYLVEVPGVSSNTPGSTQQTTLSLGTSDGSSTSHFDGTLTERPIAIGTVVVQAGNGATYSIADGDGDGNLTGRGGSGTINYATGAINVNWIQAPPVGENVIVTYSYSVSGSSSNPQGPGGVTIYSLTIEQTGNILDAIDSRGMRYHGEISSLSQGGGGMTGNTSGSVVGNFSMTADDGAKIVGVFTGNYVAPTDNGATAPDTTVGGSISGKAASTINTDNSEPGVVTTGRLLNRQMQGTYIGSDGSNGDIQGQSGSLTVTVP